MKIAAFAFLLAQFSYGPFTPGPRDHSFAVGVAPQGMLVAWSETPAGGGFSVIHAGLIDFEGQWISPVRTLTPLAPDNHVTTPVIATDGERFFVAWLERDRYSWLPAKVAGALVDTNGEQIGATYTLGRANDGVPSVVWDGLQFKVYSETSYVITPLGAATKTISGPVAHRVPFANPDAHGWVDWFEGRQFQCGFGCFGNVPSRLTYTVEWAIVSTKWIRSGSFTELGYHAGRPAVLANAEDLLVIWRSERQLVALPIVDSHALRLFRKGFAHDISLPVAAEKLIVVESGGDLWGVPVVDGPKFGDVFRITESEEWETQPRVYLVGPNRYFVTWVLDRSPAAVRLGGQFVTIP